MDSSYNTVFNKDLCIICQKRKIDSVPINSDDGMRSIKKMSLLKKDEVFLRLNLLSPNGKN